MLSVNPPWHALKIPVSVRRVLLRTFYHVNIGDIVIRHHHTGEQFRLHSFKHKGYWWHGKRREAQTMDLFASLIDPGDTVLEAGGHIGYVALYLRSLCGSLGQVFVFEPGINNLPYLHGNVRDHRNIEVIECGLGREDGVMSFYLEHMTGQNNSFVRDFPGARENGFSSHTSRHTVKVTTLDGFVKSKSITPKFIKIDVEGFEYDLLLGAAKTLRNDKPKMMVEVQAHHHEIFEMLTHFGYQLFNADFHRITKAAALNFNTFCLHADVHRECINRLSENAMAKV